MMDKPLVSAVITTHNRKKLIVQALESVLTQTYSNTEIIIVDDASEDGTKDILRPYISNRLIRYYYINKEKSQGGNYARNLGIKKSKGKYIAFLDDDDLWLPDKTEKQGGFLEKNSDYGLVYCGRYIKKSDERIDAFNVDTSYEGDCKTKIFTRIFFVSSTLMIRKQLIEEIGLFDERLSFWQEYELAIRACQASKVGLIREHLIIYSADSNDENRLTNKLDGWWPSVEYIKEKHESLISNLDDNTLTLFNNVISRDGAARADACGRNAEKRRYLFMAFKNDPNMKNALKCILNTTSLRPRR